MCLESVFFSPGYGLSPKNCCNMSKILLRLSPQDLHDNVSPVCRVCPSCPSPGANTQQDLTKQLTLNGHEVLAVFHKNLETGEIFLNNAWVVIK